MQFNIAKIIYSRRQLSTCSYTKILNTVKYFTKKLFWDIVYGLSALIHDTAWYPMGANPCRESMLTNAYVAWS